MKITKRQLQQIIKEELSGVIKRELLSEMIADQTIPYVAPPQPREAAATKTQLFSTATTERGPTARCKTLTRTSASSPPRLKPQVAATCWAARTATGSSARLIGNPYRCRPCPARSPLAFSRRGSTRRSCRGSASSTRPRRPSAPRLSNTAILMLRPQNTAT